MAGAGRSVSAHTSKWPWTGPQAGCAGAGAAPLFKPSPLPARRTLPPPPRMPDPFTHVSSCLSHVYWRMKSMIATASTWLSLSTPTCHTKCASARACATRHAGPCSVCHTASWATQPGPLRAARCPVSSARSVCRKRACVRARVRVHVPRRRAAHQQRVVHDGQAREERGVRPQRQLQLPVAGGRDHERRLQRGREVETVTGLRPKERRLQGGQGAWAGGWRTRGACADRGHQQGTAAWLGALLAERSASSVRMCRWMGVMTCQHPPTGWRAAGCRPGAPPWRPAGRARARVAKARCRPQQQRQRGAVARQQHGGASVCKHVQARLMVEAARRAARHAPGWWTK